MTKDETLATVHAGLPQGLARYQVRARWLADLIAKIRASGQFPYNSIVEKAAAGELGELTPTERHDLGTLVYNAQDYAREISATATGFVRATQDLLATLEGKQIDAIQLGSLAGEYRVTVKRDGFGNFV